MKKTDSNQPESITVQILNQPRSSIVSTEELAEIHRLDADAAVLEAKVSNYSTTAHVARRRATRDALRANPSAENTAKLEAILLDEDPARKQNELIRTEMKHAARHHFTTKVAPVALLILNRALTIFDAERADLIASEERKVCMCSRLRFVKFQNCQRVWANQG